MGLKLSVLIVDSSTCFYVRLLYWVCFYVLLTAIVRRAQLNNSHNLRLLRMAELLCSKKQQVQGGGPWPQGRGVQTGGGTQGPAAAT